jgi:uncharacterized protein YecE (DUF72 family)
MHAPNRLCVGSRKIGEYANEANHAGGFVRLLPEISRVFLFLMSQLNLFGEPASDAVEAAEDSPLNTSQAKAASSRWPGLYLGTSSWSFPGWTELIYKQTYAPAELAKSGLSAYSQIPLFRTVSLDRTYYRTMDQNEFRGLSSQVPSDFRFVVKAPRDLLKPSPAGLDLATFSSSFLTPAALGLGDRLGVVLLQFPPGTNADFDGRFLKTLSPFLRGLPKELQYSVEIRDADLLGPQLTETLHQAGVSLCGSIHSALPNPDQQLLMVPPAPDTPIVFRWNIRPSLSYEDARNKYQPFRHLQSEDPGRRALLVSMVARALEAGRQVFLTANNKAEGCAPLTLLKFLEELSSNMT